MPALAFLAGSEELGRDLTLTDTVLLSEDIFQVGKWRLPATATMQENKRSIAVLQRWLQEDITAGGSWYNGNIGEGLMLYLFMLHAAENDGRAFYDSIKANLRTGKRTDGGEFVLPWLTGGPVVRDVFLTLDEMRTADPEATALKRVTRRLYAVYLRQGSITATDFSTAVRSVSAVMDWPRSRKDSIQRRLRSIADNDQPSNRRLKQGLQISLFPFRPEEWLP